MVKYCFLILNLIFLCISTHVYAKDKFILSQGTVSISIPVNWQSVLDLYGLPLAILGPMSNGSRPIISFTPTKLNLKFDQKSLENNYDEYKVGREEWVKESDGLVLEFFPYKVEKSRVGIEIHRVGYSYLINKEIYFENSYYITCGEQLFHSKTILKKAHLKDFQKNIDDIIGSFDCK